jgi:hypothetical protein
MQCKDIDADSLFALAATRVGRHRVGKGSIGKLVGLTGSRGAASGGGVGGGRT